MTGFVVSDVFDSRTVDKRQDNGDGGRPSVRGHQSYQDGDYIDDINDDYYHVDNDMDAGAASDAEDSCARADDDGEDDAGSEIEDVHAFNVYEDINTTTTTTDNQEGCCYYSETSPTPAYRKHSSCN